MTIVSNMKNEVRIVVKCYLLSTHFVLIFHFISTFSSIQQRCSILANIGVNGSMCLYSNNYLYKHCLNLPNFVFIVIFDVETAQMNVKWVILEQLELQFSIVPSQPCGAHQEVFLRKILRYFYKNQNVIYIFFLLKYFHCGHVRLHVIEKWIWGTYILKWIKV